ncbi:hypothetical protein SAICODRAFT_17266 [Saitoella complicata NRRL Y-17804]|uniref:uncharacterized protein n=1 Tax=Saitoella complicata (strain BCRC 22490 / CBS 7301 / JCM 7358 / NBRC 10748 / NRRL Y-17804) TaxID=698492 RepID=UPI0008678B67|nr:uncharacterized protein SAICODRAFT_17266 [Saitoella complicata NRRL Y-17804]ODQ55522.1 hypothetical protein SAICODRAFT_17266 [Saitoella complicata NRRL Y-17804]
MKVIFYHVSVAAIALYGHHLCSAAPLPSAVDALESVSPVGITAEPHVGVTNSLNNNIDCVMRRSVSTTVGESVAIGQDGKLVSTDTQADAEAADTADNLLNYC